MIRLLVFCLFSLCTVAASAATCNSTQGGDWTRANRWDCGAGTNGPPGAADAVVIGHAINFNTSTTVASVTVNSGNLTQTGTSIRTLTVTGGFTNSATVADNAASGRFDLLVGGNLVNNGTFTVDNMAVSGSSTLSTSLTVRSTYAAKGTLTKNSGSFSVGTLVLDASGAQAVTFYGSPTTVGNLDVSAAAAVSSNDPSLLTVTGNLSNAGSLSLPNSKLTFAGTSAQITSGSAFTVQDIILNNSSGLTLGADATATGVLTLSNGLISTGSKILSLTGNCSSAITGYGSSRFVIGNLRLTFPAWGMSCVYPVGTGASGYAPMTVDIPWYAGIVGGTLTGTTVVGEHPQIASSTIDSTKNVNRYWNLGGAGDTMATLPSGGSYNLSLGFVAADLDAGADVSTFKVGRYQGSAWSALAGSASGTTAVLGGQTDFGSYAVGPPAPTVPVLSKVASASAAAVGDSITFTITAQNLSGSVLSNVAISDVLPAGMVYSTHVTTLGTAVHTAGTVAWSIPSLPVGASAQLTLVVSLTQQGSKTNTVTSPGSTSASATILVLASAITHFKLDEPAGSWAGTAGEVLDSGGTALHGRRVTSSTPTITNTLVPVPTIASQYSSVAGSFCNAATFDGKAVVEVAESALFDYTNKLSASVWIYPTAYPSELSSILSNDQNYEFHLDPSGRLYWWWGAASFTSDAVVPLNQWTHIAITLDSSATGGRQRIYINGVADTATNNWKGTLAANPCKFYIGGDVTTGSCAVISGRNFRGMIDEVKLYNYELTASEVQADMTLGRNCSGGYDHIRIEHDGAGSICTPESVTVKACLNSSCSTVYPGNVTVNLSPGGWVGGNTVVLTNGVGTASLSNTTAGNVTLGSTSASPAGANVTRCFNGGTETCTMNFASASCLFDAVEPAANPKTRLFTKLAGTAFSVDVLALTGSSVNTTYTGTVAADLVDASTSTCPTGAGSSLTTAQNLTFVAGNAGRKPVSFTYAGVAKNVRVRMVVGSGTPACSTDNFAIRPGSVTLTSSANATAPGATATPIVKAGSNFNLSAAATSGYGGTITLDTAKLTAQTTTQAATVASGGMVGILSPATLTVNASPAPTANASYGEVGYLYLAAGAFRDETFTAVDQPAGCAATSTCDCVTDSTSDNYLSTSLVGSTGRYGCFVGSGASTMGRFVPDHFQITPGTPVPACGTFTYFAQDGIDTPFTLTAQNVANGTTTNYAGSFAKLGLTTWSNFSFTATPALPAGATLAASATAPTGTWGSGTASVTARHQISRPTALTGVTHVKVSAKPVDADGVTTAAAVALGTTTPLRTGRLRLLNFYGSELLPARVEYRVESWNDTNWITNTADTNCSALAAANLARPGLGAPAVTYSNGVGLITFPVTVVGNYDIAANLNAAGNDTSCNATHPVGTTAGNKPWLQFGWCTGGNKDPNARIRLGSPKAPYIYLRERY